MKSTIKFYLALILRRLPVMALIVILAVGMGVAIAVQLPNVYSTSARLLVVGAEIPDELASSTVRTEAAEQLDVREPDRHCQQTRRFPECSRDDAGQRRRADGPPHLDPQHERPGSRDADDHQL
jgi:hypothetical protein